MLSFSLYSPVGNMIKRSAIEDKKRKKTLYLNTSSALQNPFIKTFIHYVLLVSKRVPVFQLTALAEAIYLTRGGRVTHINEPS